MTRKKEIFICYDSNKCKTQCGNCKYVQDCKAEKNKLEAEKEKPFCVFERNKCRDQCLYCKYYVIHLKTQKHNEKKKTNRNRRSSVVNRKK